MRTLMSTLMCGVLMLMTLCVAELEADADPLVFAAQEDYAPYSFSVQGEPRGIDVDVFKEMALRAGLDVEIKMMPWSEVVKAVKEGTVAGGFSFFRTPERQEFALYTAKNPMHVSTYSVFGTVAKRFPCNFLPDLQGHKVGIPVGVAFGDDFYQAVEEGKFEIVEYDKETEIVKGVLEGQVDCMITQTNVTHQLLKKMGLTSTVILYGKPLKYRESSYVVLSKSSTVHDKRNLLGVLELALFDIITDGTYREIQHKYMIK